EPDDVVALLHHGLPPVALDVVLDLHAERAVVPGSAQAAVDLAGREDDPPPLGQADQRLHAVVTARHHISPSGWRPADQRWAGRLIRGPAAPAPGYPPGAIAWAPRSRREDSGRREDSVSTSRQAAARKARVRKAQARGRGTARPGQARATL